MGEGSAKNEEGERCTRTIAQTSTFDSTSSNEGVDRLTIRLSHSLGSDDDDDKRILDEEIGVRPGDDRKKNRQDDSVGAANGYFLCFAGGNTASQILYVSALAIFGTVLRIYMGRFFGLDCMLKEHNVVGADDFLTPISSLMCITSNGKLQHGGAIFIDLPANILGS